MIGNEVDATAALYGGLPKESSDGTSRIVYRAGDVVYKVNRGKGFDDNLNEWNNYITLLAEPMDDRVAIPETHLYIINGVSVIAMEYIEGQAFADCYCTFFEKKEEHDQSCFPPGILELVSQYIGDTGGLNVIRSDRDGKYYLIDLAG